MDNSYRDRWIECTPEDIQIRGYYFPWGTKRIAYGSIRSLRHVALSTFRGRLRIWGTADPRYWASRTRSEGRSRSASSSIWAGTCGPS